MERAGLQFALDRLIGKTRATFGGALRLHFDAALRVPTILAKAFYKITECAVDMAKQTPGCSLIDIQLKRSQGEYVLEISDDAKVDETGPAPLGQLLMDYHASKNHVTLKTERVPGKGSVIRASFPLPLSTQESGSQGGS